MSNIGKSKLILVVFLFLIAPSLVGAVSVGDVEDFYVERNYDTLRREQISAVLVRITDKLLFYFEQDLWESLNALEKGKISQSLNDLSKEFERKIYPTLTSTFGPEAEFGVNEEKRTSVLIHSMVREAGGYFSSGDIYERIQYPKSNQRKIVYLNSRYIQQPEVKGFLAHEFVHLITVNQKEILRNITEETWLNEARAEFAPTLMGYDNVFQGSNLQKRVNDFLNSPSVSLTEWLNKAEDYGAVNLFTQYLVDHYGVKILADSLQSKEKGIESINYALAKNGFNENFEQVFANWLIALLLNDCQAGEKYCYLSENLQDIRVVPVSYYFSGPEVAFSTHQTITYWGARWHKFAGLGDNFIFEFHGADQVEFEFPYVLCDLEDNCSIEFLDLDENQKGRIVVSEFGQKYSSLKTITFVKGKVSGFNGRQNYFSFSWEALVQREPALGEKEEAIKNLLAQIEELKKQIAELQAKINEKTGKDPDFIAPISCQKFDNNLYFGLRNDNRVKCLQEFLKNQGSEIYPQGLVTGNFLSLTQQAVVRFQEKYAQEILAPLGLEKGTGYVGQMTREKINKMIE